MTNYKQQAERWLKQARDDLETAQALLKLNKFSAACFYAEQSAQKSIKGFLISHKKIRVAIHSITELLKESSQINNKFKILIDDGKKLDKHYLTTRYPDALPESTLAPFEAYTKSEAKEALVIAKKIFNACKLLITQT